MPVKINGASSGSVTLAAPSSGSDVTLTLPTTALATTANVDTAVAPMGLVAVAPTSIANSGGSASLSNYTVSFSGVSSVSLNGVFTGDYDNYSVVASFAASGGANMYLRLRAAGSDATTGYQSRISNLSATYGTSVSTTYFYIGDARTAEAGFSAIVFRPQLAVNTALLSHSIDPNGASIKSDMQGGYLANTTAYDGFTFYPNTGTITGVISVYGYKN